MSRDDSVGGASRRECRPEPPREERHVDERIEQRKRILVQRLRGMIDRVAMEEYHKISLFMAIAFLEGNDPLLVRIAEGSD